MSSKSTLKPLLARNPKVSEHLLLSSNARPFSAYQEDLEANLRSILRKYPHLDRKKVADLLEELDNNRELAMQILDTEESHCNSIMEERREGARQLQLSQEEENKLLKQSFLSLYKKLLARTAQLEETSKKYEAIRAENEQLKQFNKYMLLQSEQSRAHNEDIPPVC